MAAIKVEAHPNFPTVRRFRWRRYGGGRDIHYEQEGSMTWRLSSTDLHRLWTSNLPTEGVEEILPKWLQVRRGM